MNTTETIVPVETMEEAVEQGARLLDKYRPGWENTVRGAMSQGLFDMTSWETCMVGTLELTSGSDYAGLYISFNGLAFSEFDKRTRYVGFLPLRKPGWRYEDGEAFDVLDRLWREQVEARLNPDS